jgi:hypothetical protein
VKGAPRRVVALDGVAEANPVDVEVGLDRDGSIRKRVLPAQRNELILRVDPRDRGHVGPLGRAKLHVVGAPVGIDHEIGDDVWPGWLDQDVDLLGICGPALGVADDPPHSIAGRDRSGADKLLAFLQSNVCDLAGRRVDLVERAFRIRIDLYGIEVAASAGLHTGGGVGKVNTLSRIARFGC